jgi:hypothetical protein
VLYGWWDQTAGGGLLHGPAANGHANGIHAAESN